MCSSANAFDSEAEAEAKAKAKAKTKANRDIAGASETQVPGDLRLREAAAGCIVAYFVAFVSRSYGTARLLRQLARRRCCGPNS